MPATFGQLRLQPADHVGGADLALLQRLQVDQNAAAVQRRVGAVDADERRQAVHRRILQNHLRQRLLQLATFRSKETDLRRFRNALNHAGILNREESLGDDIEQVARSAPAWPAATSSVMVWKRSTTCSVLP